MTRRSFIIGIALLVALTLATARGGNSLFTGGNSLPVVVVFLVIVFSAVINPILRRFRPESVFTQGEIVVVWCVLAAGLTISSCGVMRYLLPFLIAPFYYETTGGPWDKAFYEHIPDWLVPSKDPNSSVVTMFYEGVGDNPVPMGPWVVPFFAWGILLMAVFLIMFCMTAIIRKQWVEHERLSFPLAQIPLEISNPPEEGRYFNTLFRSVWMWIGAGIPIFFWGLQIANSFLPWFPVMNNVNWSVWGVLKALFGQGWEGHVAIYFIAIGITFLLPKDISLSLWFFYVLTAVQRSLRIKHGYPAPGFDMQQQAGGYFAFAAIALWVMRRHLWDVLRKAFFDAPDVDDTNEGMSYRFAVFGFIAGVVIIVAWLSCIGCNPFMALLIVGISCVALLVMARFVAQCGLYHLSFRPEPLFILQDIVGDANIGPKGLTGMTFYQASVFADQREVLMPALLNNAKMGEKKTNLRKLFAAMMLAVAISYCLSYFTQVHQSYKEGVSTGSYRTESIPRGYLDRLATAVDSGKGLLNIGPRGVRNMLGGAGVFTLVHVLRSRFYWWPLHPVGLLMIKTWPAQRMWMSFFIGWLCKMLGVKYAPPAVMKNIRRLFIGLIIGDVLIAMLSKLLSIILEKGGVPNMS